MIKKLTKALENKAQLNFSDETLAHMQLGLAMMQAAQINRDAIKALLSDHDEEVFDERIKSAMNEHNICALTTLIDYMYDGGENYLDVNLSHLTDEEVEKMPLSETNMYHFLFIPVKKNPLNFSLTMNIKANDEPQ